MSDSCKSFSRYSKRKNENVLQAAIGTLLEEIAGLGSALASILR